MFKKTLLFILLTFMPITVLSAQEMKLNWSFKKSGLRAGGYTVKIHKVELVRGKLRFSLLYHNTGDNYLCYHISTSDKIVFMDDELGNEYYGASYNSLNGQDNKLGPSQRKQAFFEIDAPKRDVNIVNLRLGLYASDSSARHKCRAPAGGDEINEHKVNWDISGLRIKTE